MGNSGELGNGSVRTLVLPETLIMKPTVFTLGIFFILINVFGQHTEYRISLNSGLFSFKGKSAASTSYISFGESLITPYTNNPYGSQKGLCYGLSGNVKRVTKKNIIFGIDLGYERLRSQIAINRIDYITTPVSSYRALFSATGKTFLNYDFLNCQPFVGYRVHLKPLSFDITGGVDIGRCLKAMEKGSAEAINGITYKTSVDRKTIKTDIRPRVQLSADYHQFGVYAGYSYGQVNYKTGYDGGVNESYSRILRFGVSYRLH
jgi:hypothetical protein